MSTPGSQRTRIEAGFDELDLVARSDRSLAKTVCARVVTGPAHPGQLALQDWFFYVFNDFNDKHEGDWEMIQLDFDTATAAAALATHPSVVGYSQHAGAESARWGDDKLQLVDGTHPVVYPARGSHANYYASRLYLGRSAAQGVGCDNTVGPSRELRPAVSLIPTDRDAYLHGFPWLGYEGHWGEQHSGFYDGPTGPNTKQQWTEPITWANESWRDKSFTVPAGSVIGTAATSFFCGTVALSSGLLTALVGNPPSVLIALAVIAILLLWLASRTRWDLSAPLPVRRRRPWGSIVTSARRMYTGHLGLFLGVGLLFVPLGLTAFRLAFGRLPAVIGAVVIAAVIVAVAGLTTIGLLLSVWLIVRWGLVAQVVALENEGVRGSLRRSGQLVRGDWWRVASLTLFVTVIGLLLGPLTGTLLLFSRSASFDFVNLASSLVFVITLPYVAIATTYLYFDLAAEKSETQAADTTTAVPAQVEGVSPG